MKLSVCGYETTKTGNWVKVYSINPTPIKFGAGYKPFYSTRNGKIDLGLWLPVSETFQPSNDLINKIIEVEFGPNGNVVSVKVVK